MTKLWPPDKSDRELWAEVLGAFAIILIVWAALVVIS